MTLLVISPDYASHALPMLALASAWHETGERVVVATGPAVAPLVAERGMDHVLLRLGPGSNSGVARPDEQPAGEDANLRDFFAATREGMIATLLYQARKRENDLLWRATETAYSTLDVVDRVQPDAIVVDHLAFGATLGLRAAGIDYCDVVLGHPRQLPVRGETYGVPGSWPRSVEVDSGHFEVLRRTAQRVAGRFTAEYNAALLTINPGADPVEDAFGAHGQPVLYNYPSQLAEPARTGQLPAAHAFLGSLARKEALDGEAARWVERHPSKPLVLVSLGTFLSARDDVLARIVGGLADLKVRVALATGSADVRRLGSIPADWLVAPYLPQVALLAHADVVVTHAGNNSVTEALAHGVPMVALPFSTDQFDGAAALERAGFAAALDPNFAQPADIRDAVKRMLDRNIPRLKALANDIERQPGRIVARAAISEWLDPRYARSR